MAEQKESATPQFQISDFNTRLRDIDERGRLIRERVLLLGKNLISSKQNLEEEISNIKKENSKINEKLDSLKRIISDISFEIDKFVKRDEMRIVERMLEDFQPLEFMRKKDVEELIQKNIKEIKKQIKTSKE